MNNEATNLDDLSQEELKQIRLDPNQNELVRRYAGLRYNAVRRRLQGYIEAAMRLEREAEDVYSRIPQNLKW